jgi:polysaccharide export outer membrane protein/exopolysaccharide production protein ExoF
MTAPAPRLPSGVGRRGRARRAVFGATLALTLLLPLARPAAASEYLLGPQDRVRLKVFEWRPSKDDFYEWKALNDTFIVGPDGTLALPFAGTVKASGLTTEQLGKTIGDRLMQHMGLAAAPDTSVEITQFRPFYIVGFVTQPGEFPYRPNLTVLEALSIAGGLRSRDKSDTRLTREVITGQGDLSVMAVTKLSLVARKARLQAEIAGTDHVVFPKQLTDRQDQPQVARILDQEKAIFQTREEGLRTQLKALKNLGVSLKDEVTSLQGQLGFHDKQIDLIQKELTSVSSLVSKGFAAAPREISLQRELAQFQSTRLAAETSLMRARQEISRNEIEMLDLQNKYKNEVAISLRDTQSQLDELASKAATSSELLRESEMFGTRLLSMRAQAREEKPVFTIVRPGPNGATEISAEENTTIRPGDTIKVALPLLPGEDELDLPPNVIGKGGPSASPGAGATASTN